MGNPFRPPPGDAAMPAVHPKIQVWMMSYPTFNKFTIRTTLYSIYIIINLNYVRNSFNPRLRSFSRWPGERHLNLKDSEERRGANAHLLCARMRGLLPEFRDCRRRPSRSHRGTQGTVTLFEVIFFCLTSMSIKAGGMPSNRRVFLLRWVEVRITSRPAGGRPTQVRRPVLDPRRERPADALCFSESLKRCRLRKARALFATFLERLKIS